MKIIPPPVDKRILERELTADKFVRKTNNAQNELYIISHHDSPNLMKEIGRLREISFRHAGGGTGKEYDIDEYDTRENNPYKQLIVWDPKHEEILGGYRFFIPEDETCREECLSLLATSHFFNFSEEYIQKYLPYTIELGRSFVQPIYQSTARARKGLFALDNLWDGLGAIMVDNPKMKYFLGKVTMYRSFNPEARNLIIYFLQKNFPDKDKLITPIQPLDFGIDYEKMETIFHAETYKENYKILSTKVRQLGENIPPLINAYMNLSPTMKMFGSVLNDEFGDVEESGIMITINDLYEKKVERHVSTYQRVKFMIRSKFHQNQ
jgi:hypothetical protein